MRHLFRITLAAAMLLVAASLQAQPLRLAHVFSDHAVLQQDAWLDVWGWGEPGKEVSLIASWSKKLVRTTVGEDGAWRLGLMTPPADGRTYSLTVCSGKESITIQDLVLGEVWVCSGQSNMEMPVGGFGFQQVNGAREAILESAALASDIRVFSVKADTTHTPQADVDAVWQLSMPHVCTWTSAVAYFFAKRVTQALKVPVGLLVNPWGGSRIEPWMPREAIEAADLTPRELWEVYSLREEAGTWPRSIASCWNGRVLPIAGYSARGFLWYQGCSNLDQSCYDKLQTAMVKAWRQAWGREEMPFIYALLAPHGYGYSADTKRARFVETQLRALETTPLSYAVCLETLGDEVTIHPPYKQEVADMMAIRALSSVYGIDMGMPVDFPTPATITFQEDGRACITFNNVWSNLMSITAREIKGFELAGADRQFRPAQAEVNWDGQTVYVQCDQVPHPVAVRYSWHNWSGANLQTSFGIPVPPFRSDNW